MRLYKILVRHYSSGDEHDSIEAFIARETWEQVWEFLKNLASLDADEEFDVYNDDFEIVGTETRKERTLRLGGDYFDDDAPTDNLYYGVTHYGWEEVKEVTEEEVAVLKACGVLTHWTDVLDVSLIH